MLHARQDYNERIQDSAGLIPDDEPVFIIRGQDTIGPAVLTYYANRYAEYSGRQPNVLKAVQEQIQRMEQWQKTHKPKLADMPLGAEDLTSPFDGTDDSVPVDPEDNWDEEDEENVVSDATPETPEGAAAKAEAGDDEDTAVVE